MCLELCFHLLDKVVEGFKVAVYAGAFCESSNEI